MCKVQEGGARIFQAFGVVHKLRRDLRGHLRTGRQHRAIVHAVMKGRLWSDPELRKNRNARANDCPDDFRKFRRAIQLDHVCAGFFHEANGCLKSAVHAFLKGTKREVATDQGSFRPASNGFTNDDHLVQRNL